MSHRDIVAIVIDQLGHKHVDQLKEIQNQGFIPLVFVDRLDPSESALKAADLPQVRLRHMTLLTMPYLVCSFLRASRRIHHLEFYTAKVSGYWIFAAALLRRIPVVTVERGLICWYSTLSLIKRRVLRLTYRLSSVVCYREPHMLDDIGHLAPSQTRVFCPNTVPVQDLGELPRPRELDFMWANRLLPERHVDWFLAGLVHVNKSHLSSVLYGVRPGIDSSSLLQEISQAQIDVHPSSLVVHDWRDPRSAMSNSRFFVMFGRCVFGNYGLLEAMARGAVPIVSASQDTALLIEDGVNGIVAEYSMSGSIEAMSRAARMSFDEWKVMSVSASLTVATRFSTARLQTDLAALYLGLAKLDRRPGTRAPESA